MKRPYWLRRIGSRNARDKGTERFGQFDFSAFLGRGFYTAFLIFSTYNPSGTSVFHWISNDFTKYWLVHIPIVITLAVLFYLTIRATILMLRVVGMGLVIAILGSIVWMLSDFGFIDLQNRLELEIAILLSLTVFFTIGISSMAIYTRLSGQLNIDDLTN